MTLTQLTLDDACARKHGNNPQSVAANADNLKHRSAQCQEVLTRIRKAPLGLTCDEVAEQMGVTPNQVSGRFSELKFQGLIKKRGMTRTTRTGSAAQIYIAI